MRIDGSNARAFVIGVISSLVATFIWVWIEPLIPTPGKHDLLVKSGLNSHDKAVRPAETARIISHEPRISDTNEPKFQDLPRWARIVLLITGIPVGLLFGSVCLAFMFTEFLPYFPMIIRVVGYVVSVPISLFFGYVGFGMAPLLVGLFLLCAALVFVVSAYERCKLRWSREGMEKPSQSKDFSWQRVMEKDPPMLYVDNNHLVKRKWFTERYRKVTG